ncbi:hypothetical protein KR009_010294 [Drosophila setifemur]|nr:hypothetical protein KR009_010294 [Drosophila setifemur]
MLINKYESYQNTSQMFPHQQQQQHPLQPPQQRDSLSPNFPLFQYGTGAALLAGVAESAADLLKAERESIHSGQFMVSHFEAEEAQDDLEDDGEVKMLDPDDPSLDKPGEPANTCRDVQLYVPLTVAHFSRMDQECDDSSMSMIASHLEIETSLTKLFKCMNLAYSQKLTSPKWNHFKGVRLRWKDKIRLNNVIWRCWHMQFIQKRRTPVCQFASPLDVDIHSNPQTVVLEGKYWKRHSAVIKAEYRKWRKNYRSKATGCLTYDSKSELDFLEWSPINDRNLMPDDWTTDTLFSAINVPFPFPDSREIARGAGIADFIQPSLGPLQPNLDDIDITFSDLIPNTRLPPVPEEGTDAEMLKNDDYCLSAIVGAPHTIYSNDSIMDDGAQDAGNVDANMLEINTPINNLVYSEIDQRFSEARQAQQTANEPHQIADSGSLSNRILGGKHFGAIGTVESGSNRCVMNGRVAKTTQRPFRREPHNYDKAQPTLHQTNLYQQMLAEQQRNQQQQLHIGVGGVLQTSSIQGPQQQQIAQQHQQNFPSQQANACPNQNFLSSYTNNYQPQQQQLQHQQPPTVKVEPLQTDVLSLLNDSGYSSIGYKPYPQFKKSTSTGTYLNVSRLPQQQQKGYLQHEAPQMQQSLSLGLSAQQLLQLTRQEQATNNQEQINQSTMASLLQQQHQQPLQHQQNTVSTGTWVSPNTILPKEIYRSNSLPLNVSLNKLPEGRQLLQEQPFAMPKYYVKGKSRVRSNSMHQQHTSVVAAAGAGNSSLNSQSCSNLLLTQQMQQTTSDPMLNSTLAQLLTSNSVLQTAVANNSQSNSIASVIAPTTSSSSLSPALYAAVAVSLPMSVPKQQHSPKKATSLPMAINPAQHSPPGGFKVHSFGPSTVNIGNCCLSLSPESPFLESQDSPLSPSPSLKLQPRDNLRRAGHIHAEQKRRYNIKNGFDTLHALIPQLQQNPNAKLSKAAMLQKGADHIKQLRQERNVLKDKIEALRMERDELNNSLTHLHSILPANGAPVTRQGTEHVRQLYEIYVRYNTMNDWKFWILGLILEPLLTSYTSTVSSASLDELRRTAFLWVDQHCSLIDLRPAVTNKLKYLSMHTDIVSEPPSTLQEEVVKALQNSSGQHPNLYSS